MVAILSENTCVGSKLITELNNSDLIRIMSSYLESKIDVQVQPGWEKRQTIFEGERSHWKFCLKVGNLSCHHSKITPMLSLASIKRLRLNNLGLSNMFLVQQASAREWGQTLPSSGRWRAFPHTLSTGKHEIGQASLFTSLKGLWKWSASVT